MANFGPLPGIPPNFSTLAAMSAGLLPANAQITAVAAPNQTLLSMLSAAGASGSQFNATDNVSQSAPATPVSPAPPVLIPNIGAVVVQAAIPESNLTFASPLVLGGA